MTRDTIEINDFIVLIEQSNAQNTIVEKCGFKEPVIGFSFYGSGNVELDINYGDKTKTYNNTKGKAISFYADQQVEFVHNISPKRPLQCICILPSPSQEMQIFTQHVHNLASPQDNYVEGPGFNMNPDMLVAVDKIFNTSYTGATRTMFIKSQVLELLSHFFAMTASPGRIKDKDKLYHAKEILTSNMETPPSLNELSRLTGLNNFKLKKNFKALFGMPVFKYLQHERMKKAHELLSTSDISIREAAWSVGYESLSSFSSAYLKQFGFRPSETKKNPS